MGKCLLQQMRKQHADGVCVWVTGRWAVAVVTGVGRAELILFFLISKSFSASWLHHSSPPPGLDSAVPAA